MIVIAPQCVDRIIVQKLNYIKKKQKKKKIEEI